MSTSLTVLEVGTTMVVSLAGVVLVLWKLDRKRVEDDRQKLGDYEKRHEDLNTVVIELGKDLVRMEERRPAFMDGVKAAHKESEKHFSEATKEMLKEIRGTVCRLPSEE